MSKIYRFRVLIDQEQEGEVFRDIEIESNQHFLDLNNAILDSFGFDKGQMASFYMSNDNWDKGEEITLMDITFDDGSNSNSMDSTRLLDKLETAGQKLVYVFDFMLMWCFFVELERITDAQAGIEYPRCVQEYGEAPDQYSRDIQITAEDDKFMLQNIGNGKNEDEAFSDDIFDGFDDFAQ